MPHGNGTQTRSFQWTRIDMTGATPRERDGELYLRFAAPSVVPDGCQGAEDAVRLRRVWPPDDEAALQRRRGGTNEPAGDLYLRRQSRGARLLAEFVGAAGVG